MSAEHAALHEQSSIHPRAVELELLNLLDRVRELRTKLVIVTQANGIAGLRESIIKAQVCLEIAVVAVKDLEVEP